MATNLFDDIVDYLQAKWQIKKGLKTDFHFQEGKCICIINGSIPLKKAIILCLILFFLAFLIGCFFLFYWGIKLFYILIPCVLICLSYPILGSLGFGEILVSIVFSPLIYEGVYFAMHGNFSNEILILAISTGLLAVAVLHNHMLLDYKLDTTNSKITLCRLCKSEKNAYNLLCLIIFLAYINILIFVLLNKITPFYMLSFLSLPWAITLLRVMKIHIKSHKEKIKDNIFMPKVKNVPIEQQNFIIKFKLVTNLMTIFTIILAVAIILDKFFGI
jgi:1,4-dihydroxy-2-naphthoate octaprenyltransferase